MPVRTLARRVSRQEVVPAAERDACAASDTIRGGRVRDSPSGAWSIRVEQDIDGPRAFGEITDGIAVGDVKVGGGHASQGIERRSVDVGRDYACAFGNQSFRRCPANPLSGGRHHATLALQTLHDGGVSCGASLAQSNETPVPGASGATARWCSTVSGRWVYSSIGKL